VRLLIIENVGNLVCPAAFDLGEHHKIALLSVTEGEDKPLKYPAIFSQARVLLLTKTDILPHLRYDLELCKANARRINSALEIMETSAFAPGSLEPWLRYLRGRLSERRRAARSRPA